MHQPIPDEAFEVPQANPNVVRRIYDVYNGIQVKFPYEAYECQRELMTTILQGVSQSQNCLLESDTGSGKTAVLLCALLALQQKLEDIRRTEGNTGVLPEDLTHVPKIIYAVRTHTHLKQVIGQLKLTEYVNTKMTILASVSKTCNNVGQNDQQGPEQVQRHLQRPPPSFWEDVDHHCRYDPESFTWSKHLDVCHANNNYRPWDLQDLQRICQANGTCPYYELRNVKVQDAQIIFCTYNYLLHSGIRQAVNLEVANNILVFDEGHNIEDLSREMASSPPGLFRLDNIKLVLNYLSDKLVRLEEIPDVKIRPMEDVRLLFQRLQTFLENQAPGEYSLSFDELMEDFQHIGLNSTSISQLWENYYILEDNNIAVDYDPVVARYKLDRPVTKIISSLLYVLSHIWEGQPLEYLNSGKYDIRVADDFGADVNSTELHISCLDPSVGFKHMNTARSILIASATITSMDLFAAELGTEFQQRYSQPVTLSIVSPERVFSARIGACDRGVELKFNFDGVRSDYHQEALGKIIIQIARVTPYGILVFLPSKAASVILYSTWQVNRQLDEMRALKPAVFFEHLCQGNAIVGMLESYRAAAETRNGAILFAYFRGHLSEGVDFRDNQCRGLITVGIPFAPPDSVRAKREYQDRLVARGESTLNGWDWYRTNAVRALNQGIGRVIRHAGDYGAVLNVDSRYFNSEGNEYESRLPRLVQATMRNNRLEDETVHLNFNDLIQSLNSFFTRI